MEEIISLIEEEIKDLEEYSSEPNIKSQIHFLLKILTKINYLQQCPNT